MQAVEKSFSNLLPLLALLGGILALLLVLAFLVRLRIRRDARSLGPRGAPPAAGMRKGDVVVVLGRTFAVEETGSLALPEGPALWAHLAREEGPARLLLCNDLSLALYFPGRAEAPAGDPELIQQDGGEYRRVAGLDSTGGALSLYRQGSERCLMVERCGGSAVLWRGKAIPPEGVSLLEEKEKV